MKKLNRRQFILWGCGSLVAALSGCNNGREVSKSEAAVPQLPIEAAVATTTPEPTAKAATATPEPAASNPAAAKPTATHLPPPTPTTSAPSVGGKVKTACPFGLVNDPYPGRCRRYVDRNGNGICDLSEPA